LKTNRFFTTSGLRKYLNTDLNNFPVFTLGTSQELFFEMDHKEFLGIRHETFSLFRRISLELLRIGIRFRILLYWSPEILQKCSQKILLKASWNIF